jgi:molecular chaperone GrpE
MAAPSLERIGPDGIIQSQRSMDNQNTPAERAENDEPLGQTGVVAVEAQLAALVAERDKLADEKAELYDRLLRGQADFENFRRRVERERAEISEYATMEGARSLLPVLDDFERALQTETADKNYARGMELIHQRLKETVEKMGVEALDSVGKRFDPHVHHAIEMTPNSDVPDHTVLAEYQRGYSFRGRLLRPAMVKVAVTPSGSETPELGPEQAS